jgi:hypothetical protein
MDQLEGGRLPFFMPAKKAKRRRQDQDGPSGASQARLLRADHGALGDEHLLTPLASQVGAPQLKPQLGGAAGQDQDRGAWVAVQSLSPSVQRDQTEG